MLIAALVFGLMGGLVGLPIGVLTLGGTFDDIPLLTGNSTIAGSLVLLLSLLAIVGAVRSRKNPWQGAALLFLSGTCCMVVVNIFGAPIFFLTFLASFSAIRGRREVRR
ncbi:MAG: hypothetical protein OXE50_01940 [Chloroflexi bacterium]|nr:hypothetical protein [Chloroflexota bacterium]